MAAPASRCGRAGAQLSDQRRQQIDRHDHVDVTRHILVAGAFDVQRADSDEPAVSGEKPGAAPERMRGGGENRLVEEILPIAGEFVLGDDPRFDELAAPARSDHDGIADLRVLGTAERDRRQSSRSSACASPRPDSWSIASGWAGTSRPPGVVSQIVSASVMR